MATSPGMFQTRILLLNATTGALEVLTTLPGIAVKGVYCLDERGNYHFTMRDATSSALVSINLVDGRVQKWANMAFGDMRSMHCINPEFMAGYGAAGSSDASVSRFNLVGIFPSRFQDEESTGTSATSATASPNAREGPSAHLWFLGKGMLDCVIAHAAHLCLVAAHAL